MRTQRIELIFILDRSGSMSGLESDTIGGYNAMLKEQKEKPGEACVTTVLFDHTYELLHDRIDIRNVEEITENEYFVRGTTALLDAVGMTVNRMVNVQKQAEDSQKAGKVLFVIVTDGLENASREYTFKQVKSMITYEQERYGWEFLFLGANIDAAAAAQSFGINADRAARYHADRAGTRLNYATVSATVSEMRECGSISASWKEKIDRDYKKRKKIETANPPIRIAQKMIQIVSAHELEKQLWLR